MVTVPVQKDVLLSCLDKLEAIIDLEHIKRTKELQKRAFNFDPVDHVPTNINFPLAEDEWPNYSFDEIFNDSTKMLLQELRSVYAGAKLQDDRMYGIRANYGTGIIASMFGCETKAFDNTLPIGLPVSSDKLEQILESDVPDLNSGIMSRVFETAAYFREALRPYPKLSKIIGSEVFDIQGPFDNASIIWGSEIFLAFYDAPEKIRQLMSLVTETTLAAVKKLRQIEGLPLEEHDGVWNCLGGLCVRNDSSVNLSEEQYVEIVKPFDVRMLEEFGGWIHFCGRAHQWWKELLNIPNLKGINPYQGECYDLFEMFETCESAKVPIVQWTIPVNDRCRERIRTGFSRIMGVSDYDQALRAKDILYVNGHADNA